MITFTIKIELLLQAEINYILKKSLIINKELKLVNIKK